MVSEQVMHSSIKLADINSLVTREVVEDALEEVINKPDRSTDLLMNKRTALQLHFTSCVMEVYVDCTNRWLGLVVHIGKVKHKHPSNTGTSLVNSSLNHFAENSDAIHLVLIMISDIG